MSNSLPFFQFFPKDWLSSSSVRSMSLDAQGAYMTLLCYQWQEGFIAENPDRVRALLGVDKEQFEDIWPQIEPKFPVISHGKRANPRMEADLTKANTYMDKQRSNGALGGRPRKAETDKPVGFSGLPKRNPAETNSEGRRQNKQLSKIVDTPAAVETDSSLLGKDAHPPLGSFNWCAAVIEKLNASQGFPPPTAADVRRNIRRGSASLSELGIVLAESSPNLSHDEIIDVSVTLMERALARFEGKATWETVYNHRNTLLSEIAKAAQEPEAPLKFTESDCYDAAIPG